MKKLVIIPLFFIGIAALITWVLMLLWNWLMPDLFNLTTITFWQALGLLLLSKLLFGGMNGGKHHTKTYGCNCQKRDYREKWNKKFKHKWANMSELDKEKWQTNFKGTAWEKPTNDNDFVAENH